MRERQRLLKNVEPSGVGSPNLLALKLQVVTTRELEVRIERAFHRRTVADGKRGLVETRLNEVAVVLSESVTLCQLR